FVAQGAAPRLRPGLVNGALWIAARNGLSGELVDPLTASSLPAFELIDRLVEVVGDRLDRFGDLPRVERYLERLRATGGPAQQQLARFSAAGVSGVLGLYRESSARPADQ